MLFVSVCLDLSAKINYSLKLDAKRQSYRAFFSEKERVLTDTVDVSLIQMCKEHAFNIEVFEMLLLNL